MTEFKWAEATLTLPLSEESQMVADALGTAVRVMDTITTASKISLDAMRLFDMKFDARTMALQAALGYAENALNDLVKPAAGHMLIIPPAKPFQQPPGPPAFSMKYLKDLGVAAVIRRDEIDKLRGDGGNYGFYRRFTESLMDEADHARPIMAEDSHFAGAILMLGSSDYRKVLADAIKLMDLFGTSSPVPFGGYQLPVPQNVKVKVISPDIFPIEGETPMKNLGGVAGEVPQPMRYVFLPDPEVPEKINIRVSWDPPKPMIIDTTLAQPPGIRFDAVAAHVYIKEHSKIEAGEVIEDYQQLSIPILPELGALGTWNSCILMGLKSSSMYYVSVAYEYKVVSVHDDVDDPDLIAPPSFGTLSNQVRVFGKAKKSPQRFLDGLPPDWIAVRNPMTFFPAVREGVAIAQAGLAMLKEGLGSYGGALSDVSHAAIAQAEELDRKARKAQRAAQQLANAKMVDFHSGAHVTAFHGKGGTPNLIQIVGDLLLNKDTVNRPPYDQGDEYISAVVVLACSDTYAQLEPFLKAVELLFGVKAASSSTQGTSPARIIEDLQQGPSILDTRSVFDRVGIQPGPQSMGTVNIRGLATRNDDEDPC